MESTATPLPKWFSSSCKSSWKSVKKKEVRTESLKIEDDGWFVDGTLAFIDQNTVFEMEWMNFLSLNISLRIFHFPVFVDLGNLFLLGLDLDSTFDFLIHQQ